jgi:DNA-nicking Smr family endonuclease
MGSGNKERRKQRQRDAAAGKSAPAGGGAASGGGASGQRGGAGGGGGPFGRPSAPAGVVFDLEPDADQLFLESMESMDSAIVEKKKRRDERETFDGGISRGRGAGGVGGGAPAEREIDLHRMTLAEAIAAVDAAIAGELAQLRSAQHQVILKIITGKGLHSGQSGSVLPREVHRHVQLRYAVNIVMIEESPADVKLGGVPMRGHFRVTLRGG